MKKLNEVTTIEAFEVIDIEEKLDFGQATENWFCGWTVNIG